MGIQAYARFWRATNSLMNSVASMARMVFKSYQTFSEPTPKVEQKELFALVIGINTYNGLQSSSGNRDRDTDVAVPTFTNLRGAVADAQEVYDYLTSDLGVPKNQITFLRDKEATRTNIIAAFRNLASNKDIKEGDSIFIYYAGHGAQTLPPKRLLRMKGCPEKVEVLVPHDYGRIPSKHESMGIPDYSIGALLNQIAEKKGDNITVIFDCCHSASALRGSRNPNAGALTRSGPDLMYHLPDELDRDIWNSDPGPRTSLSRGLTTPSPLKHFGSTSYVFFAACSSSELAREMDDRGCFTSALITLLKKLGHSSFSCSQLITHLPKIEGQSPQCEGVHQDRLIFHGYVSAYDKTFFNIAERPTSAPDNSYDFIMKEGRAHGFSKGDELTIYKSKSKEDRKQPVGVVIIDNFDDISGSSRLKILPNTPYFRLPCHPAPALLTRSIEPHLKLYIGSRDHSLVRRIRKLPGLSNVVFTVTPSAAHISISVDKTNTEERLCFEVVDQDLFRENPNLKIKPRFAPNSDDDDLQNILNGLAHYYWHLKRTSDSLSVTKEISPSFFKLQDTFTGQPRFIQEEGSPNLCNTSNVIDIEIDEEALYGLEITKNSEHGANLFPVLFYFDNTDFTITQSYKHPVAGGNPESPWPGPSMTIGYGVGSGSTVSPFSFYMDEAYDTEVGFFKLMLSNKPIDLDGITQTESPFARSRAMKQKTALLPQHDPQQLWGSITLTVITRRKE